MFSLTPANWSIVVLANPNFWDIYFSARYYFSFIESPAFGEKIYLDCYRIMDCLLVYIISSRLFVRIDCILYSFLSLSAKTFSCVFLASLTANKSSEPLNSLCSFFLFCCLLSISDYFVKGVVLYAITLNMFCMFFFVERTGVMGSNLSSSSLEWWLGEQSRPELLLLLIIFFGV